VSEGIWRYNAKKGTIVPATFRQQAPQPRTRRTRTRTRTRTTTHVKVCRTNQYCTE
jgi:hypothetical protein